jgi:YaiO family outer membrane protein
MTGLESLTLCRALQWAALALAILGGGEAFAQESAVERARVMAQSGDRAGAIVLLEQRLASAPDDLDARTLYGTILWWEERIDEARAQLRRVVATDPSNLDARLALIRVELAAGNHEEAARMIDSSLALDPGNAELAELRRRVESSRRRTEARIGIAVDDPQRGSEWSELFLSAEMPTRAGVAVARVGRAERGEDEGSELALELYPRLGAKTYAVLHAAASSGDPVYPDWRLGAEIYHGFAGGWEGSLGYRRLEFDEGVDLATASLGRYIGDWLIGGRVYLAEGDTAVQGIARHYFGEGRQYLGVRVARGSARDELRTDIDLDSFDSTEAAVEGRVLLGRRWFVEGLAGWGDARGFATLATGMRF